MATQRLDVVNQMIAAVGGGVCRCRGLPGAAVVHQDQPKTLGLTAEITEVRRVLHRTARQTHHRGALAEQVVGEFRSVIRGDGRHGRDRPSAIPIGQWKIPRGRHPPSAATVDETDVRKPHSDACGGGVTRLAAAQSAYPDRG